MTWHSQAGQDEWVHSIVGDTGYFVDVGAHDGVTHSNSLALEQRGWNGVCIEPDMPVFRTLRESRRCDAWMVAASSSHGLMSFDGVRMIPDPLAGPIVVTTVTLAEVCECLAPRMIDYLSIDVEGHELEVLDGMDFDRWHVRLATIEHNLYLRGPDHRDAIRERMIGLGFVLAGADVVAPGYGPYEDWWIHQADL